MGVNQSAASRIPITGSGRCWPNAPSAMPDASSRPWVQETVLVGRIVVNRRRRRRGPPRCSTTTLSVASPNAPRLNLRSQSCHSAFQPTAHPRAASRRVRRSRNACFSSSTPPRQSQRTRRWNGWSRCHQRLESRGRTSGDALRHGVNPPLRRPQSRASGSRKWSQAITARQRSPRNHVGGLSGVANPSSFARTALATQYHAEYPSPSPTRIDAHGTTTPSTARASSAKWNSIARGRKVSRLAPPGSYIDWKPAEPQSP